MKVQLTVASCDGSRILNLQQFTDLKVINSLASNEVVEPVYDILINKLYDETFRYLKQLDDKYVDSVTKFTELYNTNTTNFTNLYDTKYASLNGLYLDSRRSLEDYMHTAENGGNANSLQGNLPRAFSRVENTIEELINSANGKYREGDVVDLLGYYTAGDGAHHKRKIESADDGSGVQLANGLWANIVHNGEVYLDWYGDYSRGFEKAFVKEDVTFIKCYLNKAIKLSKNIARTEKLNIDLNDSTFLFEDDNKNVKIEYSYKIPWVHIPEKINILGRNSLGFKEFMDFKKHDVLIKKYQNDAWCDRVGAHASEIKRSELNFKKKNDVFSRPFHVSYTEEQDHSTYYRECCKGSVWKNFNVSFDLKANDDTYYTRCFRISRDNFRLENINILTTIDTMITGSSKDIYRGEIFSISDCYNATISNVIASNFIGLLNSDSTEVGRSGYVFGLYEISKIKIKDCFLTDGWGCIGGTSVHDVLVENCTLNRFDSHTYSSDWKFENCRFLQHGLIYPEMYGFLKVNNCEFYYCNIANRTDFSTTHNFTLEVKDSKFFNSGINHIDVNTLTDTYKGGVGSLKFLITNCEASETLPGYIKPLVEVKLIHSNSSEFIFENITLKNECALLKTLSSGASIKKIVIEKISSTNSGGCVSVSNDVEYLKVDSVYGFDPKLYSVDFKSLTNNIVQVTDLPNNFVFLREVINAKISNSTIAFHNEKYSNINPEHHNSIDFYNCTVFFDNLNAPTNTVFSLARFYNCDILIGSVELREKTIVLASMKGVDTCMNCSIKCININVEEGYGFMLANCFYDSHLSNCTFFVSQGTIFDNSPCDIYNGKFGSKPRNTKLNEFFANVS